MSKCLYSRPLLALIILLNYLNAAFAAEPLPAKNKEVAVKELIKSKRSWNGKILPPYKQGQPEITILKVTIPPGSHIKMHYHPVINAGMMLRGQLTVITAEGAKLYLNPGDPIIEVVNTLHYGINEGNIEAEIVVFYAGVEGEPITVTDN